MTGGERTRLIAVALAGLTATAIGYALGTEQVDRACPLVQDETNSAIRVTCPPGEMTYREVDNVGTIWCAACSASEE